MGLFYEWTIDLPTLWLMIGMLFTYMFVVFTVSQNLQKTSIKQTFLKDEKNVNVHEFVLPLLIVECIFIIRRKIPSYKDCYKTNDEAPSFLYVFS